MLYFLQYDEDPRGGGAPRKDYNNRGMQRSWVDEMEMEEQNEIRRREEYANERSSAVQQQQQQPV